MAVLAIRNQPLQLRSSSKSLFSTHHWLTHLYTSRSSTTGSRCSELLNLQQTLNSKIYWKGMAQHRQPSKMYCPRWRHPTMPSKSLKFSSTSRRTLDFLATWSSTQTKHHLFPFSTMAAKLLSYWMNLHLRPRYYQLSWWQQHKTTM